MKIDKQKTLSHLESCKKFAESRIAQWAGYKNDKSLNQKAYDFSDSRIEFWAQEIRKIEMKMKEIEAL